MWQTMWTANACCLYVDERSIALNAQLQVGDAVPVHKHDQEMNNYQRKVIGEPGDANAHM